LDWGASGEPHWPAVHCTLTLSTVPPRPHDLQLTESVVPGKMQPVLGEIVTEAKDGKATEKSTEAVSAGSCAAEKVTEPSTGAPLASHDTVGGRVEGCTSRKLEGLLKSLICTRVLGKVSTPPRITRALSGPTLAGAHVRLSRPPGWIGLVGGGMTSEGRSEKSPE